MEHTIILILLSMLLGWRNTGNGDAAVSPSWKPVMPAQLPTNIAHRDTLTAYRFNLHQNNPPVYHQSEHLGQDINRDQCALYKVVMTQQLYFEYIQYKIDLPELKEFTLCMWKKFTNHTNDHPLFSYAVGDQARSILSWIANTQRSSYYMLNIDGHNLYRLNYPLRLNRWYHSCQSWNGRTGEWQIWVNDERVGRGFNNRLVGHVIKGGGVAISGQEQRQLDNGFLEGQEAPLGTGGMLGELTMVQLYKIALTAGKAHRDHKHHHAHHFEHNTNNNVPTPTTIHTPITGTSLPSSPYLTGGQLNHQVKINPGSHIQIIQNGVTLRHPNLPVPAMALQPLPPLILPTQQTTDPITNSLQANLPYNFAKTLVGIGGIVTSRGTAAGFLSTQSADIPPVNGYNFIDRRYRDVITGNIECFNKEKREQQKHNDDRNEEIQKMIGHIELKKIVKRENLDNNMNQKEDEDKNSFKKVKNGSRLRRSTDNTTLMLSLDKKKQKRGLVFTDGSIIDDSYIHQIPHQLLADTNGSYLNGLTSFAQTSGTRQVQKHKEDEREPAEEEVRRIMNICDGCADEPFEKAVVMSWRTASKKLYSGALHMPAVQVCQAF